jgi:uracil-DNA glycosylase
VFQTFSYKLPISVFNLYHPSSWNMATVTKNAITCVETHYTLLSVRSHLLLKTIA